MSVRGNEWTDDDDNFNDEADVDVSVNAFSQWLIITLFVLFLFLLYLMPFFVAFVVCIFL